MIKKHPLLLIFVISIILRLSFSFYFQQFYFGDFVFKYKDTYTYLNPILNLINHGSYIGDMYIEDSKYFRVPAYPIFLGAVHLVVGAEYLDVTVAILQSIIDSFSAILIYLIIRKITESDFKSLISGLLYATYPFVILWSPISYTEVIQIFIIFSLIYLVSKQTQSLKAIFIQGLLVGILILTKQYLGLFVLVPVISIVLFDSFKRDVSHKLLLLFTLFSGVVLTMAPWVIRNYLVSGKIIVLKGESTGLRARGLDFEAFEKFANLFNENITPLLNEIAYDGSMTLERHPEFVYSHKKEILTAVEKAHVCGPSFMEIRSPSIENNPPYSGCEKEVVSRFNDLTRLFWQEVPFFKVIETRVEATKKIFLKSDIVNKNISLSKAQLMKQLLFKYRVLLLLMGILGLVLIVVKTVKSSQRDLVIAIGLTACSFYGYFALIIVHVEMRYILVPDLLVSIFAAIPIVMIMEKFQSKFLL
jgi:hypothetical protein